MEEKNLKAKDVYLKTMKFVWLKLALGGAIFLFAFFDDVSLYMAGKPWRRQRHCDGGAKALQPSD